MFFLNFPSSFAGQRVSDKDPTVWQDGARPANTCIPLSFPGNVLAQHSGIPNPKNTFASIKKFRKLRQIVFYKHKNQRNSFAN